MDASPKILLWNYSVEEMIELDQLFERVGAPEVKPVEKDQGELPVHELLFTDNRCGTEFTCDERVMLFFNVAPHMIHTIMQETKNIEVPRPIFAVVTPQSIEWKFSELVDHLVRERDFIRKKAAEDRQKKSPLRKIES
jgi:hypothetical protein